jgi:hypothetical protein
LPPNTSGIFSRSRQPVDPVLEHARDAVVVLGRDQQQTVAGLHLVLQHLHRLGQSVRGFDISVVERDAVQCGDFDPHAFARDRLRRPHQRGVERPGTQAAGNAQDRDHGFAPRERIERRHGAGRA